MASSFQEQMVIGAPFRSPLALARLRHDSLAKLMVEEYNGSKSLKQYSGKDCSLRNRMKKMRRKADGFAYGLGDHLRLGPKLTEIVKGKLRLGARIVKVGGLRKIYEKLFTVKKGKEDEEEQLLKASHCYLSTTAAPIAGLLFISTHKIAFCSDTPIKITSPNADPFRFHYKVVIPVGMKVNESENVKNLHKSTYK